MNHPNLSHVKRGGATVIRRAIALMVASFNGLGSPASAADITLAEPLCGELKKERPEVRNFAPVEAHALLALLKMKKLAEAVRSATRTQNACR